MKFDFLKNLFQPKPNPRHAQILARLDAKHAAERAALEAAQSADDYARLNYYSDYDFARYEARGDVGWMEGDDFTPPPTPEQWAKLTPEQKADTVNPVLPENLP